ncbi:MAG: SPFH domain-containing protein [Lachnospiraceae bacterium]|nr:SPFH domain-containing protein [Lachnospiraceae bacterium]
MGIIKAAFASASSMSADQYKEYFYSNALPGETIMLRALKMSSERSDNHGSDDIVTDGSVIAVADGQFAIVVSNGKVIAEYKEPGEHIFESGETTSIFHPSSLKNMGKEFGKRFSFGGDTPGVVQRVYYFNTKEMPGEEFSGGGIPFRVLDENTGLDIDCTISVTGYYTYRVADPMKIYKQMIGNIEHVYSASYLLKVMSSEVKSIILSSFGSISGLGMRPSGIAEHLPEIEEKARQLANEKLYEARGIELVSFGLTSMQILGKDSAIVKDIQKTAVLRDPEMANAAFAEARNEALPLAAANSAGPSVTVVASAAPERPKFCTECGAKLGEGKFCRECGHPV